MTDNLFAAQPQDFRVSRVADPLAAARIATALGQEVAEDFGARDEKPFCLEARDEAGVWLGGLRGVIHWRWLYVAQFFVAPDAREKGLGATLLREAESLARENACVGIYLDTFAPRAENFYLRHGFELFGALKNFPPGATRRFLSKSLTPASA